MLAFWQIDMCKEWKNQLSAATTACDFQKVYLRSIPCCNKCQLYLFHFQRFDKMLFLSSSPKLGICLNRSNLHISSFLRFDPGLRIIDKHCNKIIDPATNKIRWPHTSNILDIIFHWISAAFFWLQNFNKELIKEINVLQIFVKEQCFEKKCFDNKKWKEFSSAMDRPMFLNMSKTFCHLGRLGTWNSIGHFPKLMLSNAFL